MSAKKKTFEDECPCRMAECEELESVCVCVRERVRVGVSDCRPATKEIAAYAASDNGVRGER